MRPFLSLSLSQLHPLLIFSAIWKVWFFFPLCTDMVQQKIVLKLLAMNDEKTKQKAIEAVAEIYGIDSIAADSNEQKMTIIGEMDTVAIAKKLKKIGKIDIISVGPAKEEKKEEKKDDKKGDPKKQDKK